MVKATLVAMTMKGLALLAGKALVVSKIALTLAVLIAIKKLFSHQAPDKTTYEIVKTPVVSHAHEYHTSHRDEHEEGYARSAKEDITKRHMNTGKNPHRQINKYRYERYEQPTVELTTPRVPYYYINEADANDDSDMDNLSNTLSEVDAPVYDSGNKWSPKLSETVEPIRNNNQAYNSYGYRNARVMNSVKSVGNVAEQAKSEVTTGAYNSFRSGKSMSVSANDAQTTKSATKLSIIVTPSPEDANNQTKKQ
ncbi:hypothetical protein WDU94_001988 [Cyamophila willieti]